MNAIEIARRHLTANGYPIQEDGDALVLAAGEDRTLRITEEGSALVLEVFDHVRSDSVIQITTDDARLVKILVDGAANTLLDGPRELSLAEAVVLVVNDQRQGDDPRMPFAEAVAHARNTLALPGEGGPGAFEIQDYGDGSFEAYKVVLEASDEDLAAAVAELA